MELIAVAAVAENGVIGHDGELPWPSVPADRRQYRERVSGHPVLMGRQTFESMVDDLPGDLHIVLTADPTRRSDIASASFVADVEEAIELAEQVDDRAYVIGGGRMYETLFPYVIRLYISRIPGAYEGDTEFPPIDPEEWTLVSEQEDEGFTLEIWERQHRPRQP